MNEAWFFVIWLFIVGLCIGSFLNVVVLRAFSGESIVLPPSKCPKCSNKLTWWMNIPLLSYLLLRGKCYYCKVKISPQYPIVEFVTAVLFLLVFYCFGFSIKTIFFLIAVCLLVVLSVTDLKESVIFDVHAYILIAVGVIFNVLSFGVSGLKISVVGVISGFILYELFARLGYLFAKQRAFGEGDSLIAAGIGAFFGWKLMIISSVLSVLIMAIFTFPYFFVHSCKQGKKNTCAALILSVLLIIGAYFCSKLEFVKTFYGCMGYILVMMTLAFCCVWLILSDMKKNENNPSGFCMLPFGPAMAVSFLLIMCFENGIYNFCKQMLNIN